MGKSDAYVFPFYKNSLKPYVNHCDNVAFLGFSAPNHFTDSFDIKNKEFYDYQLGNWDINSNWVLKSKFNLIICTRCAYFAKDPRQFIQKSLQHLSPGGTLLVDWGLGDHWRFKKFKIGWVRDEEHEYASYEEKHYLQSAYWLQKFDKEPKVLQFLDACKQFGYDTSVSISKYIEQEVPNVCSIEFDELVFHDFLFLWPDFPQLTLLTLFKAL